MTITADILDRRRTHFVLWSPQATTAPDLLIGQFQSGNPPAFVGQQQFTLSAVSGRAGLWAIPALDCHLLEGQVYCYWFIAEDTRSPLQPRIPVTDPTAYTVDWRLNPPGAPDNTQPASIVLFRNSQLVPCDPGGETAQFAQEPSLDTLPSNNQLVIYELPTAWAKIKEQGPVERDVGTFQDVTALIDHNAVGANFASLDILRPGRAYLSDLGVNALELLPPADSFFKREWGYDTSHYLAPDFELGFPDGNASPTASTDLTTLVNACHSHGIRFFVDMVMAFAREEPYRRIANGDFYIEDPKSEPNNPDAHTSQRADGSTTLRDGFGSTLFRYDNFVTTYDPMSGQVVPVTPARQLMLTYLTRWMLDFHIDGIRLDSVENIASWDFIRDFKNLARSLWQQRWIAQGLASGADAHFLVVGEELSLPMAILQQGRLDGLWNDPFRAFVRAAILGENADGESSFEWTVRKAIDCRNLGFQDGSQAINYITSHDMEGPRRERLFTMLRHFADSERRIKLAFVCLLTAVGIPMILAGEEFADQNDLFDANGNVSQNGGKQIDPVNFTRLQDPFRQEIFAYVARLVKFRTQHAALAVNNTDFIHVDFHDGKRVLVWRRGGPGNDPVVVVANFSDFTTANANGTAAEYVVPNWPATPPGRQWREVTQDRLVPQEWVGREPIFSWEAKVYTLL
ncbi:MAG: hypothetical protein JWL77_3608 [Chthonomonadaceae bacterium]|nr:hypothetical protein [Chthonomonadaceae bacterium]